MEEKESTVSTSPGNSADTESPPPVSTVMPTPQMMNFGGGPGPGATTTTTTAAAAAAVTTATPITTPRSGGSGDLFGKKKRGRPRKYDSDGNLMMRLPTSSLSSPFTITSPNPTGFTLSPSSPTEFNNSFSSSSAKRGRGRPPGSGNWQLLASLGELFANTAGADFTPHVVTVNTGEDVAGKILSFSQKGARGVCVLSANGAVSNVTIRQPGSAGGILTYEGRFEILSLSGSFTIIDNGSVKGRTGGLSVSLAGPDGRVIGGGVAGLLMAASPIQIVVGSFMPNGYKVHKRKHHRQHTASTTVPGASSEAEAASRPSSQPKPDGETLVSPLPGQNHGEADNKADDKPVTNTVSSHDAAGWTGMGPTSIRRPSPDINLSVPSE